MKDSTNRHILGAVLAAGTGIGFMVWWLSRKSSMHVYHRMKKSIPVVREKILVINTKDDWEEIYNQISTDVKEYKILGFDCEWVNTEADKNRPVSVLQLCSCNGLCILVRGNVLRDCPQSLRQLLSDKAVLKAGVSCVLDAQKMTRDHNIVVRGCVDLRHIAARCRMKSTGGLAALSKIVLDFEMDKDMSIRVGNWEADPLSEKQIIYAATDAAIGLELFFAMIEQKFLSLPRTGDFWKTAVAMCQGIVDLGFNYKRNDQLQRPGSTNKNVGSIATKPLSRAYSSRQKPLYHNCQLWAPDGQLLCTCDTKKALWYVEKGLAALKSDFKTLYLEKVRDDPLTVKLLFEPSGRPMDEQNYYLQDKENVCVVCGSVDSYIRKNIVPHEYRKYFPPMMKEHRSHDIVLMCLPCHQRSGSHDAILKQELSTRCDAPLATENGRKFTDDQYLVKVRSAAKALRLSVHKLPASRKTELETIVHGYFGDIDITKELLKEAGDLDVKVKNRKFIAHGEKVVKYMMENDGLVMYERTWRQHFLDSMQPKFLPALWSVDHSHQELQSMDEDLKQIING